MANIKQTGVINTISSSLQSEEIYQKLPPGSRTIYNEAVNEALAENTSEFVNTVDSAAGSTLNFAPSNLIGPSNPLDVVSSNVDDVTLSSNLNDYVGNDLTNNLTNVLAGEILGKFQSKLPPGLSSKLNLGAFSQTLQQSTLTGVGSSVGNLLDTFSADVLSPKTVPPIVRDIDAYFNRAGGEQGFEEVNKLFDSQLSDQALKESARFNINSAENAEKLITQTTGFIDPTATYPNKLYQGRPETNKLAQGDVTGTIVQTKEKERLKGIQLPNNQSWEQPKIPFKGEYPYNKVIETEGGHVIEIDDTPGVERIHVYHRTGTFVEIDTNGSVVKRTKGSSYEIIDKNGYISVSGDANLSVKGSIKIFVGGDANIEVEGDTNLKCLNDITMQAAGRVDISATEEINLHSANINIEADVNLNVLADNSAFVSTGNEMHFKANTSMFSESIASYNVRSGGGIFNQATGSINFLSSSTINADGSQVYLNSGTSIGSVPATYTSTSNIGLIGTRKDIVYETIDDPAAPNYLDKYGFAAEDSEIPGEAEAQQKDLITRGITPKSAIVEPQIPLESESPKSIVNFIIEPNNSLLTQTFLPDNYQLSEHFTLGQVSSKAVVSNYPVVAQLGLSYGQIVYNLSGIALNVLEPILKLYPNMFVTSGFRTARNSSTTSDHPRGKAVDIQFKGINKSDYYNIAKKLAVNLKYDKLLLEYKTYGTGLPWIHISFDIQNPRGIVLTYLNDKKYGNGLTNLS